MDTQRTTELVAGDTAGVALHQLRLAVADFSKALIEALGGDRTNAVRCLRRAEGLLKALAPPDERCVLNEGPRLTACKRRLVLEHIESNLALPLRNKELACLVDYSEFHFNVAFRNSVGASPHEFVIRRRMERAQQLMLATEMPLCDIASECGLADQAHLSRLFRKAVGDSPAAWRRARENAIEP